MGTKVAVVKSKFEVADSFSVEFVLMRLEVAELSEVLVAVVQLADEGLDTLMNNPVGVDIAALSEFLSAKIACVGFLAGVSTLVSLEVTQLGEALTAEGMLAMERFDAGVGAQVDVEMSLLHEALCATPRRAMVLLLGDPGRARHRSLNGLFEKLANLIDVVALILHTF